MSTDGFTVISLSSLLSSYGDTVAQGILGHLRAVRGRLRLDCADELIGYYERHGFSLIRKNEDKDLNQMVTLI